MAIMKWGYRLLLLATIALLTFLVWLGIGWGLPTRLSDHYLFMPRSIWTGQELAAFDRNQSDSNLGADVDPNPLDRSQDKIVLNDTDEKRAEIIRRYRLYSNQPDEMITFRALQRMKPSQLDLDPHLYQYGGLWIYGTGALLKLAGATHYINITADKTFYYDHPEEFGKFYVVARFYTLICYALLLMLVGMIASKLTRSRVAALSAMVLTGIAPVIFAMAHEAKPHLPGAMLMCLSCYLALRYLERRKRIDLLLTSAACGLALGMVLSSIIILTILPVMIFAGNQEKKSKSKNLLLSVGIAFAVYFVTNPYVLINLLTNRAALSSNLSNTRAMYHIGSDLFISGYHHLRTAASFTLIGLGLIGLLILLVRKNFNARWCIVLIPAGLVLIQFVLFSHDKPAEYARFSIFPVIALTLLIAEFFDSFQRAWTTISLALILIASTFVLSTKKYITAFDIDSTPSESTRLRAAAELDSLWSKNAVLQLFAEPAPYSVPPVGMWNWKVVLSPPSSDFFGNVVVKAIDDPALAPDVTGYAKKIIDADRSPAPITWANKPIVIYLRK